MTLADKVVAAMRTEPPGHKWKMHSLRRLCGFPTAAELAKAVQSLRFAGKVAMDRLQLSPSMYDDAPGVATVAATGLDAEIKAEAAALASNRKAVRTLTTLGTRNGTVDIAVTRAADAAGLSMGGQMQAVALDDNVLEAVSLVRREWNAVWRRVCLHAGKTRNRPIPAMIALLEAALDAAETPDTGAERAA